MRTRHALEASLAVERQQEHVEQVRHVKDLAVATTDQEVRLLVGRALVLPQQFGAFGHPQVAAGRTGRRFDIGRGVST